MKNRALGAGMALAVAALALASCQRAVSNVQTIISDDCGENWTLIPVGDVVPARIGFCALMVTVPNYPMAGESNFIGTFERNVRVNVNSSYDYTIVDPLKFIQAARFVGRQNSQGDDVANRANVWDTAENIVIDRNIREVANSPEFLQAQNITDFNPGEFETLVQDAANALLAERGVQLNSFTFVVTPDDQTRNMIDVAAAIRVCLSIQEMTAESCQDVMIARASAPRVIVTSDAANIN